MSKSGAKSIPVNYKAVKDRMLESTKGFWKVQSIHRLTNRLKNRYNPRDFIILKTIKKPPQKLPSFISLEREISSKNRQLENQKNISCLNLRVNNNFFITADVRRLEHEKKKEQVKLIFDKLFGSFTYEPFLYNDFQFLYMQKEKRLLPRKFKDVIKDCLAYREYIKHIEHLKKQKEHNLISIENSKNLNKNNNLSFNGKRRNDYYNIFERFDNNKNGSFLKHKMIKRKCFSSHNVRDTKSKRNVMLKSDMENNGEIKKYPTLRIKSIYKLKEN